MKKSEYMNVIVKYVGLFLVSVIIFLIIFSGVEILLDKVLPLKNTKTSTPTLLTTILSLVHDTSVLRGLILWITTIFIIIFGTRILNFFLKNNSTIQIGLKWPVFSSIATGLMLFSGVLPKDVTSALITFVSSITLIIMLDNNIRMRFGKNKFESQNQLDQIEKKPSGIAAMHHKVPLKYKSHR